MQIYMLYKLGYSVQEIVMVCVINMLKHQLYTRITTCKQIIVYTQLRVELVANNIIQETNILYNIYFQHKNLYICSIIVYILYKYTC